MCGRYRLSAKERYLRDHFGLEGEVSWQPRWNIAPTQKVPIIRQGKKEPKRGFELVRWGLIPSWAKDEKIGLKAINGMSETAAGAGSKFGGTSTKTPLTPWNAAASAEVS